MRSVLDKSIKGWRFFRTQRQYQMYLIKKLGRQHRLEPEEWATLRTMARILRLEAMAADRLDRARNPNRPDYTGWMIPGEMDSWNP